MSLFGFNRHRGYRAAPLAIGILFALTACGPSTPGNPSASTSPRPRPELTESLREDIEAHRHPSDGGGRAWLELEGSSPLPVTAGTTARFTIVFEAGPLGVAEAGMVFLQVSPFWGWSTPQVLEPELPGYTEVSTTADGVVLEPLTLGEQLLAVGFSGRGLDPGERITFVYGAGPAAAHVDQYAESASRLWISVDGDGDGVRALVPDPPTVEVEPAEAVAMVVTLPSTARPGDSVRLALALVDGRGNAGRPVATRISLAGSGPEVELPIEVEMHPEDRGALSIEVTVPEAGIVRIEAQTTDGLRGRSNPLFVTTKLPRILWSDLHGHSGLSDGTGTPEDYLRYARDVASLDVVALTDHDHWGMQPLAQHPELWEGIRETTRKFLEPGRFVTLLGYEWTNWIHGHRHVLYFSDEGEILSSLDRDYEHPEQLWDALRGRQALTFAHHSAGEPVPTNWDVAPDPELEPVTEIVSVHGSSEAADTPGRIRGALAGNFVRDALDRGYRLGLIGSGDSHDGHPGLAGLASPSAGLAAVMSEELTREGVWKALSARKVYATNGPRILLHTTLAGEPMGSDIAAPGPLVATVELVILALTEEPIAAIDIIRSGQVVETLVGTSTGNLERLTRQVAPLGAGEYLYVRVVQVDGGAAWSSPFFGPPADAPTGR